MGRFKHLWDPSSWMSHRQLKLKRTHHLPPNPPFLCNSHLTDPPTHLPLIKARGQESSFSLTLLWACKLGYTDITGEFLKIQMSGPIPRDFHLTHLGSSLDIGIFTFILWVTVIIPFHQALIFPYLDRYNNLLVDLLKAVWKFSPRV